MTTEPKDHGQGGGVPEDGRRARTARTRAALMAAFLDAARKGRLATAEELSLAVECSIRTVFERFQSIEGLGAAVFDDVLKRPCIVVRPEDITLPRSERLRLFVTNWGRVAEDWHVCWNLALRSDHPEIERRIRSVHMSTRLNLKEAFLPELGTLSDIGRLSVIINLEAILDIAVWRRMRLKNSLSVKGAVEVWRQALEAFIPDHARDGRLASGLH